MPPYGRRAYTGLLGQNTVWARLFLGVLNVLIRAQLAFDFVCLLVQFRWVLFGKAQFIFIRLFELLGHCKSCMMEDPSKDIRKCEENRDRQTERG